MAVTNWEEKYQTGDTPWNKGEPSPGLMDFLANHPGAVRGPVAVPGCGFGHDACAWARAGVAAVGFDLAPSAVALARKHAPAGLPVSFEQADFLEGNPPRRFNALFEHTLYCAIQPEMRAAYARAAARWVQPGGTFVAVHYFLPVGEEGPPFGCDRNEILSRFSDGFELLGEWIPRSYPNRVGLERLFWWRRRPV